MTKDSLLIRLYSFSYRQGAPGDPCGNGGGFVFDCRILPNPGRMAEYADLTGLDYTAAEFLNRLPETADFLQSACRLIENTAVNYRSRGFNDLMAAFGCTGGKHRSVFCAEQAGQYLQLKGFNTRIIHWELGRTDARFARPGAMLLAAGEGLRLRPLTENTPKALIKIGGRTMLDWNLEALSLAGFKNIVINTYHLKEQIAEHIERHYGNSPHKITISEEPALLGSGGGVKYAARWLHSPLPVIIHNADIYTEFDLANLYRRYNPADFAALVCQKRSSSRYLLFDEEGCLCGRCIEGRDFIVRQPCGRMRKLAFAGIHILSPDAVETIHTCASPDIIDFYLAQIQQGRCVRALKTQGIWFDIGTAEKLERLRKWMEKGG